MAGLDGAGDDPGGLGHVQAPLGLQAAPQGDVGEARVVGEQGGAGRFEAVRPHDGAGGPVRTVGAARAVEADDHERRTPLESRPTWASSGLRSAAGASVTAGPENWL